MSQLIDYSPGLGKWAGQMLARFDRQLHAHRDEIAELAASGIGQARIATLYPFDWTDYLERSVLLLSDPATLTNAAQEMAGTSSVLWSASPRGVRDTDIEPPMADDLALKGYALEEARGIQQVLTIVTALHALRGWPFHDRAEELGFTGFTFAEDRMRKLGTRMEQINASLERLLRILATSPKA